MRTTKSYDGTNFITGLRAIAVFLVYIIHSGGGGLRDHGHFLNLFVDLGKYGVQIFFVISGFTIFFQLFGAKYTFRKFILVRIARISLPYFPILIVMSFYMNYGGTANYWADLYNGGEVSFKNIVYHVLYLAFGDVKYANTIIGVEWTLNVEVFFYCVIGFAISTSFLKLSLWNLVSNLTLWLCVAIIFIGLAYTNTLDKLLVFWTPFTYGWMFILGGIGYYSRLKLKGKLSSYELNVLSNLAIILSFISVVMFMNFELFHKIDLVNGAFFALLTFMLLVFVRDSAVLSTVFTNRIILFMGSISFSFYLLHIIVIQLNLVGLIFKTTNEPIVFAVDLLLTIMISYLWCKFFEQYLYKKVKKHINKSNLNQSKQQPQQ